MDKKKDQLDRRINDFATRSFRDIADGDYIAARLAYRAELMPQAMWSAQQALEKYLKYILLVNRVPAADVGHDINAALQLVEQLPWRPVLRPKSRKFLEHIAAYGEYRYLDVSYFVVGYPILELDMTVWDIRRYCQVLDVFGKVLPPVEQRLLEDAHAMLRKSMERPPHEFRLHGGYLEKVIANAKHPSRSALLWQNAFFGNRRRPTVRLRHNLQAANAPLYLYPDMLEELLKYVYIPKDLRNGYREHLRQIVADPSKRP